MNSSTTNDAGSRGGTRAAVPRRVCCILGTAYCGSSLLNLLLDTQPRIRGIGEAVNLVRPFDQPFCARCRRVVFDCDLKPLLDPDRFYGSIFDHYGDCDVLIDSSKAWWDSIGEHPREPEIAYHLLLLSKSPHEFAHSQIGHLPNETVESSFTAWAEAYPSLLDKGARSEQVGPSRLMTMTYAQLAEHSEDAVREMCSFLKTDFDPDRLQHWWETDSHIIGGNNAILYQVNWPAWFDECDDYLDGKYRGRRREIFRDMAWASDTAFVDQCRKCYLKMGNDLEPLLRQLGHGGVDQQLSELSSP